MVRFGLSGIGGVVLLLCSQPWLMAQESVGTRRTSVSVPFVGCKSEGQAGPIDSPTGTSVSVPMSPETARRLAYYKADMMDGVLAPRSWYCLGIYGSGGAALLVSPEPIDTAKLFSTDWPGLAGPVVSIDISSGESSGRTRVAEIIARVFPSWRWFADQVYSAFDQTPPSGSYPKDRLIYKNKTMVEYETPARTDGLGTDRLVMKSGSPIEGVAILVGKAPDLVLLSARLPGNLAKLTPEIVRQVERAYAK
jgi:hypothetical protein